MTFITLSYADLVLASLLLLFAGGLSVVLHLGLEGNLAVAAARMVVQLTVVGLVLKTLFALVSPWWTGAAALAMVLFAGREVMARQKTRARRRLDLWAGHGEPDAGRHGDHRARPDHANPPRSVGSTRDTRCPSWAWCWATP